MNICIFVGTLNKDTRLVLISAIHFKDNWLLKFDKKYTYDDVFYLNKEKSIKIPMMRITNHFNFIQKDSYKVLELLYEVIQNNNLKYTCNKD